MNADVFHKSWVEFCSAMDLDLEDRDPLFSLLCRGLTLIGHVLRTGGMNLEQRCPSFYISYAWPEGNPEWIESKQLPALLGLLEAMIEFVSGQDNVFFDRSDMSGDIMRQMDTQISKKDFAILIGSFRLKDRVMNQPKSNIAFEFIKIMDKKRSLVDRIDYLFPLMIEGDYKSAFPNIPQYDKKSPVTCDNFSTLSVEFTGGEFSNNIIFDCRSVMKGKINIDGLHKLIEVVFYLDPAKGIVPTCFDISAVYAPYSAAVQLLRQSIDSVSKEKTSKIVNEELMVLSKAIRLKAGLADVSHPEQLNQWFYQLTTLVASMGNFNAKLNQVEALLYGIGTEVNYALALEKISEAKKAAKNNKDIADTNFEYDKIRRLILKNCIASGKAQDTEKSEYVEILLNRRGIEQPRRFENRDADWQLELCSTALDCIKDINDMSLKKQLRKRIQSQMSALQEKNHAKLFPLMSADPSMQTSGTLVADEGLFGKKSRGGTVTLRASLGTEQNRMG